MHGTLCLGDILLICIGKLHFLSARELFDGTDVDVLNMGTMAVC